MTHGICIFTYVVVITIATVIKIVVDHAQAVIANIQRFQADVLEFGHTEIGLCRSYVTRRETLGAAKTFQLPEIRLVSSRSARTTIWH